MSQTRHASNRGELNVRLDFILYIEGRKHSRRRVVKIIRIASNKLTRTRIKSTLINTTIQDLKLIL